MHTSVTLHTKSPSHQPGRVSKKIVKTLLEVDDEDVSPINESTWGTYGLSCFNDYNQRIYSEACSFNKIPSFFSANPYINYAIGRFISQHSSDSTQRILELGSGEVHKKWEYILSPGHNLSSCALTLSDFYFDETDPSKKIISDSLKGISVNFKKINLLEPFEVIPESERYDWVVSSYTFDSVFSEYDRMYMKKMRHWFEVRADPESLHCRLKEYGIREISISEKPFGATLNELFQNIDSAIICFPGGLIEKIVSSIKTILKPGGFFVFGEIIAVDDDHHDRSPVEILQDIQAVFKIEYYPILRQALCPLGFKVEIFDIKEFILHNFSQEDFHRDFPELIIPECVAEKPWNTSRNTMTKIIVIKAPYDNS